MKLSYGERKFHETFVWPAKVSPKVSLKLSDGHRKFQWNFRQTFVKLSRDSVFDVFFRQKNASFSACFCQKTEKFRLGFYQKNVFCLIFSSKHDFFLDLSKPCFLFYWNFLPEAHTCYSLLCFFVCFQRIAFPPVRFKKLSPVVLERKM